MFFVRDWSSHHPWGSAWKATTLLFPCCPTSLESRDWQSHLSASYIFKSKPDINYITYFSKGLPVSQQHAHKLLLSLIYFLSIAFKNQLTVHHKFFMKLAYIVMSNYRHLKTNVSVTFMPNISLNLRHRLIQYFMEAFYSWWIEQETD